MELIGHMNMMDFRRPANLIVLYGEDGVEKAMVLAHLMHYGYCQYCDGARSVVSKLDEACHGDGHFGDEGRASGFAVGQSTAV